MSDNSHRNHEQYLIDDFKLEESWRIFKIISEFVEGFEQLSDCGPAITIFGSARTREEHEDYQQALALGNMMAKSGITVITGGGPGIMAAANRGALEALIQTDKIRPFPIILYGSHYWQGLFSWLRKELEASGYIREEDLSLLQVIDDVDEIASVVKSFMHNELKENH